MIRRPPRSTQSRSSAASDVYKRQIRFTVMLRQQSQIPSPPTAPSATATPSLSGRDQLIYDLLAGVPRTASELAAQTQLSADTVRRSLRALREQGLVRQHGGRGRRTTYQRA